MDGASFNTVDDKDTDDDRSPQERVVAVIKTLEDEATKRVQMRENVERRWVRDIRQFHGLYDQETENRIDGRNVEKKKNKRSTQFINLTRTKTNAMTARLVDLLFPTDDRNWGIKPTPVPELGHAADKVARDIEKATEQKARMMQQGQAAAQMQNTAAIQQAETGLQQVEAQLTEYEAAREELDATLAEARARSDLMQEKMDDQLKESRYGSAARDVIEDGVRIGTGVMKGPVVGTTVRTRWKKDQSGGYSLVYSTGDEPEYIRVDPWSFFPPMDARTPEEADSIYERHLLSRHQLRKMARRQDIDKDAVRRLLKMAPGSSEVPNYIVDMNEISEQNEPVQRDRYVVWEYTGPLEGEQIRLLAEALGQTDYLDDMEDQGEIDQLEEVYVRCWFCQGEVLSFSEHPLDSGEQLYSVFNLEKDETHMFGYGIPYLMRDSQASLNAAWRMMMDNAGITSGPQIVINKDLVKPADNDYEIIPWKVWEWSGKTSTQGRENPFQEINFANHQVELSNIIALARQQMDEVTAMPKIAEGEQGANVTKTAQGMAMLMNSANVIFRRIVKNYDDDMTVPNIRRLYHWNMQFNDDQSIKGDYEVDARGSSVLLVRELQAQNLLIIAMQFAGHPIFGPMMDAYNMFKQIIKAHQIASDEVMVSQKEYESNVEDQQDPAVVAAQMQSEWENAKLELQRDTNDLNSEIANMRNDTERYKIELQFDAIMNKLAESLNIEREKLDEAFNREEVKAASKERIERDKDAAKERALAAEVAMKKDTGDSSGGSI